LPRPKKPKIQLDEWLESKVLSDFEFSERVLEGAKRLITNYHIRHVKTTPYYLTFYVKSETRPNRYYYTKILYKIENSTVFFDVKKSSCECEGFIYRGYCKHICGAMMLTYLYPFFVL